MALLCGFLPGSVGPGELLIIFLVVLLFFGPRKLPEIARTIGRTLERLRRASDDFRAQLMSMDREPDRRLPEHEAVPAPDAKVQVPSADAADPHAPPSASAESDDAPAPRPPAG
jgi:TatA/E family protein of Tat protein translocase